MTKSFSVLVVTAAGLLEPSLAISASRTGETGILDLEYVTKVQEAVAAIRQLMRYGKHGHTGIKVSCTQQEIISYLLAESSPYPQTVILTYDESAQLNEQVPHFLAKGFRVLLEMTSARDLHRAEQLGVDGLIAKGNEAGGRVGEEMTFVLLQSLLANTSLPVYAHGGVGLHTAAACFVAGAAGVILDSQLLLAKESPLTKAAKERIQRMDGSESLCLGSEINAAYRLFTEPGTDLLSELQLLLDEIAASTDTPSVKQSRWRKVIADRTGWANPRQQILLLGQDVSFAATLCGEARPLAEIISQIHTAVRDHSSSAAQQRALDEGAPLAQLHGTRYPIVQGPMTRVSDTVDFALAVAQGGGLPFIALALMQQKEAADLLQAVEQRLAGYRWGVGMLGFISQELRQQQLAVIQRHRPSYVIIAGGRPDQAIELEQAGIPTYLHVPSPNLLQIFLEDGAKRFIFEGRECGGHVGPRSSFVLWNSAVDVLVAHLQQRAQRDDGAHGDEYSVLFAGGIHDGLSAAMAITIAAPLVELGVRVGVLMGTAYLFTHEAVATGAILPRYQQEAQQSAGTVLIETGLGHVVRCLPTPFVETFKARRHELQKAGLDSDAIRTELENLNVGRLRIASKGLTRNSHFGASAVAPKYVALDEEEQYRQGMFMIGQVAALRDNLCTIAELHANIAQGSAAYLAASVESAAEDGTASTKGAASPSRIAIVGMACILPGAAGLNEYWQNILNCFDAITEIPRERFDWRLYFDPDRNAKDKIYSRWGGFIGDVPFNPLDYGMPPNSIPAIEPMQLLMLEVVRAALAHAGYTHRPFPREETSVIMAVGGGLGDLGFHYSFRTYLPHFVNADPALATRLNEHLPEWTEDSFPGMLLNVLAGRVANRFDLGGANFVVDAACGSSLAALDLAVNDLELGRAKVAIVGAADTVQSPFGFMAFSKTQALSPTGRCRPLDVNADGIAISEGLAVVVLKRLDDAVRDGDTIYAVIQGVGASSDGKDRSLTAPRAEGQLRALRRAYQKANFSPTTVDLFEAHGTGTKLGDAVEIEALQTLLQKAASRENGKHQTHGIGAAIGSVKSLIGHTKSTAGLAGVIKVALGLYHKVMPPTLIEKPNPTLLRPESAIYVNNRPRPWVRRSDSAIRRAGVSAFGFGGTNFHVALEEYPDNYQSARTTFEQWPVELMLFAAADVPRLLAQLERLARWLDDGNTPPLKDLAYTLYRQYRQHIDYAAATKSQWLTVAIVAKSLDELLQKLKAAQADVQAGRSNKEARDLYFNPAPLATTGKVAFLFPGQGSQYPDMFRELICAFPTMVEPLERANSLLETHLPSPLSDYIFPRPAFREEDETVARAELTKTAIAQPALGAVSLAASQLLAAAGIAPDFAGGHSYGELVALCIAGAFSHDDLILLSATRGRLMAEAAGEDGGTMVAVRAGADEISALIQDLAGVTLANLNAPKQNVLSGTNAAINEAIRRCEAAGYSVRRLPVACAFHSPLVAAAQLQLSSYLEKLPFNPVQLTVFSNSTGAPYPQAPNEMRPLLSSQLAQPVYFQKEIETMYDMGARIFVEVGPRRVLSNLVAEILAGRAHAAIPVDGGDGGVPAFVAALAQLAAEGLPLELDSFFDGRNVTRLNLDTRYEDPAQAALTATTWLINGGSARPWRAPASKAFEPVPAQLRPLSDSSEPAPAASIADPPPAHDGNGNQQPPAQHASAMPQETGTPEGSNGFPTSTGQEPETSLVNNFHQVMSHFLTTHSRVMQAYFTGEADGEVAGQNGDALEQGSPGDEADEPIVRYTITPVSTPLTAEATGKMAAGVLLVAGGEDELAEALCSALQAQGHQIVRLASPHHNAADNFNNRQVHARLPTYAAELTEIDQLRGVLAEIRRNHGQVAGMVYLAAQLDSEAEVESYQQWQQLWQREFVGLLHLIQLLHGDLEEAAARGGASILAATSLGGCFDGSHKHLLTTLQGGIAGLIKTLAHEMPEVRVKVVDLDTDQPVELRARILCQELTADDRFVEVGYIGTERCTLQLVPAMDEHYSPTTMHLDAESVILITGGARGITAQVAAALARTYQPRIILAGRSPLPGIEPAETAGLTAMSDIKAVLLKQMKESGAPVQLADVEKAYQRLISERELRNNLEMLKESGAQIYYQELDVRDEAKLSELIQIIYAQFGRLDGVIHGAGILEDKLLRDKQADSLCRVVSTKIDSAFLLSRYLRPDSLQFLVFFSSVSGRFGNRGQGDYAAANEVLNKLARHLDSHWPGRVISVNWGPWDSVGMVNEELRRAFNQRGVALIPPHTGCEKLLEELHYGHKGAADILIAGINIETMQQIAPQT